MPNEQITNYINQSRQSGKSDEQIRQELLKTGWTNEQVSGALGTNLLNQPTVWVGKKVALITLIILGCLMGVASIMFCLSMVFWMFIGGTWGVAGPAESISPIFLILCFVILAILCLILSIWLSKISWRRKSIWPILILDVVYFIFVYFASAGF
jgi:hypothetical protein